jgi:hypothetical protein
MPVSTVNMPTVYYEQFPGVQPVRVPVVVPERGLMKKKFLEKRSRAHPR